VNGVEDEKQTLKPLVLVSPFTVSVPVSEEEVNVVVE
jgi:hypothetical protein